MDAVVEVEEAKSVVKEKVWNRPSALRGAVSKVEFGVEASLVVAVVGDDDEDVMVVVVVVVV